MEKRRRGISRKLISLVLVLVMALSAPAQAFAASNTYVKDVKMVVATSAAEAQKNLAAGYQLITTPIYESDKKDEKGAKSCTFIAYQTTANPVEAITDIRAMNMNGGWSYEKYAEYLAEQEQAIEIMLTDLVIAIQEFRTNYAAGKDSAIYAYNLLQRFVEDDTGMKLGDFMLNKALEDHNQLSTLALQCNSEVFTIIEKALMIGCQGTLDGSYGERLSNVDVYEYADSREYLGATKLIISGLEELQNAIRAYEKYAQVLDLQDDEALKEWMEGTSAANVNTWTEGQYLHDLLKSYPYKGMDNESTVYDLFMNHTTRKDSNGDVVTDFQPNIFNAAAAMMSDGQVAMLKLVGLKQFFIMESNVENAYTAGSEIAESFGILEGIEELSVYEGVDRSIFDAEGIAMTSAAMQKIASDNESGWAQRETRESFKTGLKYAMMAAGGVGALGAMVVGLSVYGKVAGWTIFREVTAQLFIDAPSQIVPVAMYCQGGEIVTEYALVEGTVSNATNTGFWASLIPTIKGSGFLSIISGISLVAIGALIIAFCIWLIVSLIEDKSVPDWLDIPRKIMNEVEQDGENLYIYYDGVRLANKENGNETNTGKFMDVGNWEDESRYRQWVAIYTTKDPNAGKPILAKGFSVTTGEPNSNVGFLQLKKFNETTAYNLTTYCSTNRSYINYKVDTRYNPATTASTFVDNTTLAFGGGGLMLGLVAGLLVGSKSRKKKNANAAA